MQKILIISGIVISVIIIVIFGLRIYTKSFSPEDQALYKDGDRVIEVNYCRPSKNEREIFGELIPYGKIWRTGANEATTISFNDDYLVSGKPINAGKYSLFSIPGKDEWTVIFNEQTGQWGTIYNEGRDVLRVKVKTETADIPVEKFTVEYEKKNDTVFVALMWDDVLVKVPMVEMD